MRYICVVICVALLLHEVASFLQVRKLPMDGNVTFVGTGALNAKWFLLNVEHVVDVLLQFHLHGDWRQAFDTALPIRKRRRLNEVHEPHDA
jgi:hypothetical protein